MSYNAAIKFTNASGKQLGLGLWVMEYSQSHDLAGDISQSKWYRHFYPRSYSPGAITVTGRVRTQQRYDQVTEFVRQHQELMIQRAGYSNAGTRYQLPLMSLSIPFENIYVEGWIASIQAGAKRFNPAPEYTFDFLVVKDSHSMNIDLRPASVIRSWWNGSIIDAGEIHNEVVIDQQDGTIYNPYTDPDSQKIG
jgi:hypothetical protein